MAPSPAGAARLTQESQWPQAACHIHLLSISGLSISLDSVGPCVPMLHVRLGAWGSRNRICSPLYKSKLILRERHVLVWCRGKLILHQWIQDPLWASLRVLATPHRSQLPPNGLGKQQTVAQDLGSLYTLIEDKKGGPDSWLWSGPTLAMVGPLVE